jgi:hypothetical protein
MKVVLYMLAFTIALASCNKHVDEKPPASKPPVSNPLLSIKLDTQYLGSTQTDSAIAVWKRGNVEKSIRLQLRNDSLVADIAQFEEGEGHLSITLFSKHKVRNQYYLQWVLKKNITIEKTKGLEYTGPKNFFDAAWLPRVELWDGVGNRAILGLRPEDSYFLVKKVRPNLYRLVVAKEFWKTVGGIQRIGGGEWNCATGCLNENGDVENTNYFDFIPGQIGARAWNHISIIVLYETDMNGGYSIDLEYDPPR